MSLAFCYVINVTCDYCSGIRRSPASNQFTGRNEREAFKALRDAGWHYYPAQMKVTQMKVKCPECRKRMSTREAVRRMASS